MGGGELMRKSNWQDEKVLFEKKFMQYDHYQKSDSGHSITEEETGHKGG